MRAGSRHHRPRGASRRRERGQAAVEAALGILAFVTVLIFGIHFAEIGYMSVKITEAAHHATWDATSRQQHQWSNGRLDSSFRSDAVSAAEGEAQSRYADWDGRESASGSAPRHVFTEAGNVEVRCQGFGNNVLGALDPGGGLAGLVGNGDQGGMRCRAEGRINVINIGSFMEGSNGFFKVDHLSRNNLRICSTGRANGGNCQGEVPIALGDWSFSDVSNDEAKECDLFDRGGCENPQYYRAVNAAFDNVVGPTGDGMQLAWDVAGFGTDEGAFWFTFKGSESNFRQDLESVHGGPQEFTVTPGGPYEMVPEYQAAHGARGGGFLGFPTSYKYTSRP